MFAKRKEVVEAVGTPTSVAEEMAYHSRVLQPLMTEHGVRVKFSQSDPEKVCIADATLNPTGAYKLRGALASAREAQRAGSSLVWTASAGNHGAGLAHAAQMLGMQAVIYVPETAPEVKVDKIKSFGARVVRTGENFDACLANAHHDRESQTDAGTFVHPFNEDTVVAGQGTIGLEILEQVRHLHESRDYTKVRIFVPIGGGGLAAGVASVVKTLWPRHLPPVEVIGVVDESSPASVVGTFFGRPVRAVPDTIADGTRVERVGSIFLSVAHLLDRIMLVPHDDLVSAMRKYERARGEMLEGSGALALAGERLSRRYGLFEDAPTTLSIAVLSGKNIDPNTFQSAVSAERRMNRDSHHRQAYDVLLREQDGELLRFLRSVRGFNIAGLTYKQRPHSICATVRAEFEVEKSDEERLQAVIESNFRGSDRLVSGEQMMFTTGAPVAKRYHDELIKLDDVPGSFLSHMERHPNTGSVGFLFYRKPARVGAQAQVIMGTEREK